jgi:sugar phosphate isomerase/epimerase
MPSFTPDDHYITRIQLNIDVAEKIDAAKIVFHQRGVSGVFPRIEASIDICVENTSELNPFMAEELARTNDLCFTLDVPHMFLYYVQNDESTRRCYEDISRLTPDHLHISNTYFEQGSLLGSIIHLLKGDTSSAFVRLVGDFHLPLHTGHINYRKVFRKLKLPGTIIMEISSTNYELLMRSGLKRKNPEDVIKRGYREDINYFKKLVKRSIK